MALWALVAPTPTADAVEVQPVTWAEEALDDTALFVLGNTLFTVYHELGHALIDLLNLPVIGRAEDAVDGFAAVEMIPATPDPVRDALIVAVADGWRLQSDRSLGGGERHYWGEHALDEQRHFAIVCLMVGSDQEGFYDFALEAGLPAERIETCSDDFTRMENGWKRLLDPHRPDPDESEVQYEMPIVLVFDDPLPEQRDVLELMRRNDFLERAVARFSENIRLPTPITIRFSACEEVNAYWSRSQHEVTVCYALINEFRSILLGRVAR